MNNTNKFQEYNHSNRIFKLEEYKIAEYQTKNIGLPSYEVTRKDFIDDVFGDFKGYICFMQITSKGVVKHFFSSRKRLDVYLKTLLNFGFRKDVFISYSTYFRSKKKTKEDKLRVQSNIFHTHMLVQDLDYYKIGISDAEFLKAIGEMILNRELICPNYLLSTGRGYQLVWAVEPFKNISGFKNDRDWHSIQKHMHEILKKFKSDDVVKNPSAVTRLPDSINRKNGNLVYAYLISEQRYTLNDFLLYYDIVPATDKAVKPKKKIQTNNTNNVTRLVNTWNEFTLNRQRETDIFTFVRIQNKRGISYVGIRNWLALVLRFHALVSSNGDTKYAHERVIELCNEMNMIETSEEEILRRSALAERYYNEWINDTWDRNKYVQGGLFYSNATLIDILKIENDYYIQWKMKTIKIKSKEYEAARKHYERLEKGQIQGTMEEYNELRNNKVENLLKEVQRLLDDGLKQKDIAEILNLTKGRVSQLVKKIKNLSN